MNKTLNHQTKIHNLHQKIQEYKAQHPKRDQKKIHELNSLWIELAFWQAVQAGKGELDPLWFKVEKSWEHLKEIHQQTGRWPRSKLRLFLLKQKPKYTRFLINCIYLETNLEYLKFARWLLRKDQASKRKVIRKSQLK